MLTLPHCDVVLLAYETNTSEHVLELIDKNVVYYPGMPIGSESKLLCDMSLPPPSFLSKAFTGALKSSHVLEYDLVCGMIWCSRRDWAKAFAAFSRVITFPTRDQGVSKIMVEAYKMWLLVGLLLTGQKPTEPAYTSGSAKKAYYTLAKPYIAIAEHFTAPKSDDLRATATKFEAVWTDDNNIGLVTEILAAYRKWQIVNLQDVYSKISILDIRRQTQSADAIELDTDEQAEELIRDMIKTGMLKGEIETPSDGNPPYLVFQSLDDKFSEIEFARELAASVKRIKDLGIIFKATNERLAMNKEFIKDQARQQRLEVMRSSIPGGDGHEDDDPTLGFDSHIEDEDLMTGITPSS